MHEPLLDGLEDYLEGKGPIMEVERHLAECASCREELALMQAHSAMFRSLRIPADTAEPAPGFYAHVMNRIDSEGKPSLWTLFGESLFAKRLAYASMTLLVLLGTVFVTTEESSEDLYVAGGAPEAIMADDNTDRVTTTNRDRDRDVVLVNLATYQD